MVLKYYDTANVNKLYYNKTRSKKLSNGLEGKTNLYFVEVINVRPGDSKISRNLMSHPVKITLHRIVIISESNIKGHHPAFYIN